MPKGQQRGNREAKKPKKAPAPVPIPALPAGGIPTRGGAPQRGPGK